MLTCTGCSAQHHDPSKEDCSLTLRCLHYPPVDNTKIPANYWRAGSHTDFDTLTLLFQVRTVAPCSSSDRGMAFMLATLDRLF